MRWRTAGHEPHLRHVDEFRYLLSQPQMAEVNRIESAAENSNGRNRHACFLQPRERNVRRWASNEVSGCLQHQTPDVGEDAAQKGDKTCALCTVDDAMVIRQ